jgi:hypothetical protein
VWVEVLAVDVDLATGHGGDGRDAIKMRGWCVGLLGRQERTEGRHAEVSVDGRAGECKCEGVTVIKSDKN